MADKVLYEPTARELLDAIEEAKKEGRKEIRIKGTYRDGTTPPIPSPHVVPWDFDPSRLRSSLRDVYIFREPDDKSEVSMEATKRVVESLKDAFPISTEKYREDYRFLVPKDRQNIDIEVGDIVCVKLIGGNTAVYEVERITGDGIVVPAKGSFYIIKGDKAEPHDEEYYMKGVGAKQVTVIESLLKRSLDGAITDRERDILSVYRAQGI